MWFFFLLFWTAGLPQSGDPWVLSEHLSECLIHVLYRISFVTSHRRLCHPSIWAWDRYSTYSRILDMASERDLLGLMRPSTLYRAIYFLCWLTELLVTGVVTGVCIVYMATTLLWCGVITMVQDRFLSIIFLPSFIYIDGLITTISLRNGSPKY